MAQQRRSDSDITREEVDRQLSKRRRLKRSIKLDYSYSSLIQIDSIPDFEDAQDVVELDFSFNFIAGIKTGVLAPFKTLTVMHLSGNSLNDVSTLRDLSHCQELRLSNNKLTSVPDCVLSMRKLSLLDLRANQIDEMTLVDNCENLKWLSLSSNQTKKVALNSAMPSLEFLGFFGNALKEESEVFKLLRLMPNVGDCWLWGNPAVVRMDDYRKRVAKECKKLVQLDGSLKDLQ